MKNTKSAALSAKIQSAPLYSIPNPDRVIFFVATKADWVYCEERLRAAKIVGIDSETRPVFNQKHKTNPCSLLQLAVRCAKGKTEVFVIDLLKLPPKVYNATISKLFLSKQVIKLGQGLLSDMKDLVASYPGATCFTVAKAVVEVNDMSIHLAGSHQPISLQKLAFYYLNKRLTKTMQTSNWNRRPLSRAQLHYAASDALVLIELYDELRRRLQESQGGKFKVESVMNVLDVHVEPTPKCTLCFETFETVKLLKAHRKECLKGVRTLELCDVCDEMQLLDADARKQHIAMCGTTVDDTHDADTDSPVEVSEMVMPVSVPSLSTKQRPRKRSHGEVEALVAMEEESGALPTQKRVKRKKKSKMKGGDVETTTAGRRPRKMSEGSLLQADDIWSDLSKDLDLSRDDGSP